MNLIQNEGAAKIQHVAVDWTIGDTLVHVNVPTIALAFDLFRGLIIIQGAN